MTAVFFAFDVETTGLHAGTEPDSDQIISLAYRLLAADLTVLSGDIFYAWPEGKGVSVEAAAVNGFSTEKWTGYNAMTQLQLSEALSSVLSPHKGLIPLGHNVGFDLGFLQALMAKHDSFDVQKRALSYHKVDTVAAAIFFDFVVFEKLHGSYSLVNLSKRFELSHGAAHTADGDIDATIELFKVMRNALRPEGAEKLAAIAQAAPPEKWCRFFGKNTAGAYAINFGKHKGKLVDEVNVASPDYVVWMYNNLQDMSKEQREYLGALVGVNGPVSSNA